MIPNERPAFTAALAAAPDASVGLASLAMRDANELRDRYGAVAVDAWLGSARAAIARAGGCPFRVGSRECAVMASLPPAVLAARLRVALGRPIETDAGGAVVAVVVPWRVATVGPSTGRSYEATMEALARLTYGGSAEGPSLGRR